MRFDNLELRLDEAELYGSLKRETSLDFRPNIFADLRGEKIDLDKLSALFSLIQTDPEQALASHDLNIKSMQASLRQICSMKM